MGEAFDLDAAAAATRGEPWTFTYGGRTFEIASDLPLDVLEAYARFAEEQLAPIVNPEEQGLRQMAAMQPVLEALAGLFGSEADYAAFRSMRPGQAELVALLAEAARRATGGSLPEPSAPGISSDGASQPPRLISGASTG